MIATGVFVVLADDGGRVERAGEAEEGATFVAAVGDGAAPPLAGARRADEPERAVEAEEDPPEQVVREVMDAPRTNPLLPVLALLPWHVSFVFDKLCPIMD